MGPYRPMVTAGCILIAAVPAAAGRPVAPRPAGDPGGWVTADDYPPAALRAEATGTSGFRLDIDASGRVTGCAITVPSGSAALDQATCAALTARAAFTPARDRSGAAVASHYQSLVHWQIPVGKDAPAATMAGCQPGPFDTIRIVTPVGCLP